MTNLTRLAAMNYSDFDGQPLAESDATRDYLIYCIETLRLYFQGRRQVYVSGNLSIYYDAASPAAVVAPDVFVVFGVSVRQRRYYKAWQEAGRLPSFILEITSSATRQQDEVEKPHLYAHWGVQEYFQYDPTADYLQPQLKGARLVDGRYEALPIALTADGTQFIHSQVLGLDLQLLALPHVSLARLPQALRFYDPQTDLTLLDRAEAEQARDRAEQDRLLAQEERDLALQELDLVQEERDLALHRAERLAQRLHELGVDPNQV